MTVRVTLDAREVVSRYGAAAARAPRARRALLLNLATQTEREAARLATGRGKPGAYPIPVRTGFFRLGFGFEISDSSAVVFNTAGYARALHNGFAPYGNPAASPIRPRPFFTDAIAKLDLAAPAQDWEAALQ